MSRRRLALLASSALLSVGVAQAASPTIEKIDLGGDVLALELPDVDGWTKEEPAQPECKAQWKGTSAASTVTLEVFALSRDAQFLHQPQDVTAYLERTVKEGAWGGGPQFAVKVRDTPKGAFGFYPYGSIVTGPVPNADREQGEVIALGGIVESTAYAIVIHARPRLLDAPRGRVLAALRHLEVTLHNDDEPWTPEEWKARWAQDIENPKVRGQLKGPVKTEHYLLFSNSGAGALFARKMESCYDEIRKVYPFPDTPGRRLMPVFVFQEDVEYHQFCDRACGWTTAQAKGTKGHAGDDYYATYYDSPNDAVHIHEATHQLMRNRLNLSGGGSWFQEGVAEYMAVKPSERKSFCNTAAQGGRFIRFDEFVKIPSLISGGGGFDGRFAYLQAASVIGWLREGDWQPERFLTFLHAVGRVKDPSELDEALKRSYGVDVAGLEKAFVKYWQSH